MPQAGKKERIPPGVSTGREGRPAAGVEAPTPESARRAVYRKRNIPVFMGLSEEKKIRLFRELRQNKTPLRLHLLGEGYERLTIVTGIADRDGRPCVLVDRPAGFESDVPDGIGKRVQLEFADKNRIPHSCRSVLTYAEAEDLWLALPTHVERSQRRRHFRVETPQGTRIAYAFEGREHEAPVLNVSMGGILIIGPDKKSGETPCLYTGAKVTGLCLWGKQEGQHVRIRIGKGEIVRIDKNVQTRRMNYAIRFHALDPSEEKALDRFIYYSQRRLLKKRSLLLDGGR